MSPGNDPTNPSPEIILGENALRDRLVNPEATAAAYRQSLGSAASDIQDTPVLFAIDGVEYARGESEEQLFESEPDMDKLHIETSAINTLAGNLAGQGWDAADHQIRIIAQEFKELSDAITARDFTAVRDGIGDLQFTLSGLAHRISVPLAADWAEVVKSNYSKFDKTLDDAQKTQAKYQAMGLETLYQETTWNGVPVFVTQVAHDQQVGGKDYPKGKWLKSHNFKDVAFEPIPGHALEGSEPAKVLRELLRDNVYFRHGLVGAIRDIARRTLNEVHAQAKEYPREVFSTALGGAMQFFHVYALPDTIEINPLMLPPMWTGTWDELQSMLPPSKAILIPGLLAALTADFVKDSAFAYGYHSNLAMAFFDSSRWLGEDPSIQRLALTHAQCQVVADSIMTQLFHIPTLEIHRRLNSHSDPASTA